MGSPMTSHMTLKGQIQGQSDFEALYLVKELGHMLLWNKAAENCHLSHQLQVSRSMGPLLLNLPTSTQCLLNI